MNRFDQYRECESDVVFVIKVKVLKARENVCQLISMGSVSIVQRVTVPLMDHCLRVYAIDCRANGKCVLLNESERIMRFQIKFKSNHRVIRSFLASMQRFKCLSPHINEVLQVMWQLRLFVFACLRLRVIYVTSPRIYHNASTKYYGNFTFPVCLYLMWFVTLNSFFVLPTDAQFRTIDEITY